VQPDTLNLKSKGQTVTCYIELPEPYRHKAEVKVSSIRLNGVPVTGKTATGDYDGDGIADLMIKFDRTQIERTLKAGASVRVTLSGELSDGTKIIGSDIIKVIG